MDENPNKSWLEMERERAARAQAYEDSGESIKEREARQEREAKGEVDDNPHETGDWEN